MKSLKTSKEYKVKVGENTRIWREIKGLKQADLAKRINISPEALSNIENGVSKPNIERIEDIADGLGIEVTHLLLNPHQLFTPNSIPTSNSLNEIPNQHFDKELMERVMSVMEKITSFYTSNSQLK